MQVRELRVSYRARDELDFDARKRLATPSEAASLLIPLLQHELVEVFLILCLSTKQRLICIHEVSRGTLDSTLVHPREVFRAAALANAASIVLAHNHPSGDPTPSPDDVALTARLVNAGAVMGIDVVDHILIADSRYYSFSEGGRLTFGKYSEGAAR